MIDLSEERSDANVPTPSADHPEHFLPLHPFDLVAVAEAQRLDALVADAKRVLREV